MKLTLNQKQTLRSISDLLVYSPSYAESIRGALSSDNYLYTQIQGVIMFVINTSRRYNSNDIDPQNMQFYLRELEHVILATVDDHEAKMIMLDSIRNAKFLF